MSHAFDTQPTDEAKPAPARHPMDRLTFSTLLQNSLERRPDRLALTDEGSRQTGAQRLTHAAMRLQVLALSRHLHEIGLYPGETVIAIGVGRTSTMVAILAIVHAGLNLVLAPFDVNEKELTDLALSTKAAALIGEQTYDGLSVDEPILATAAQAPSIRIAAILGAQAGDGMVALNAEALAQTAPNDIAPDDGPIHDTPFIATLERTKTGPSLIVHQMPTLLAASTNIIQRGKVGSLSPILTTLSPVTFAGLVTGPLLGLMSGAPVHFLSPFTASGLLSAMTGLPYCHLVVPVRIAGNLVNAGLINSGWLASLMLVTRRVTRNDGLWDLHACPGRISAPGLPIMDIYALGEQAAIPELRTPDGSANEPAEEMHRINFDDLFITVARREPLLTGQHIIRGSAVTWS